MFEFSLDGFPLDKIRTEYKTLVSVEEKYKFLLFIEKELEAKYKEIEHNISYNQLEYENYEEINAWLNGEFKYIMKISELDNLKIFKILSQKFYNDVENTSEEPIMLFETEEVNMEATLKREANDIINKPIKLIKCNVSKKRLMNAFLKLHEERDVKMIIFNDSKVLELLLDMHFDFISSNIVNTNKNSMSDEILNFVKLRWNKEYSPRLLIYFIEELEKDIIRIDSEKVIDFVLSHFCKQSGDDFTRKELLDAGNKFKDNITGQNHLKPGLPRNYIYVKYFLEYLKQEDNF